MRRLANIQYIQIYIEKMLTKVFFWLKKFACAIYSLFDFYTVGSPRELELDNLNYLEVSVTCPKSIKFNMLLLTFFEATEKITLSLYSFVFWSSWPFEIINSWIWIWQWPFGYMNFLYFFHFFFFYNFNFVVESTLSLYSHCWSLIAWFLLE